MPKYKVYLQAVASTSVEVTASDPDEAYDKAAQAEMPTICAQCSGWGGGPSLELGDEWAIPPAANLEDYVVEIS